MGELEATTEHFQEFITTVVWEDIKGYCQECIEFNRDFLDRTTVQAEGFEESDELLRGRNKALRDLINYVVQMAGSD